MRSPFLVAVASFVLLAIQVSVSFGRVLSQFRTGLISTEIAVNPFTGDLLVGHDFGVLPPQIVRFSQTGELLEHIPVPFRDYRIRGLDVLSVDTTIGDVSVPAGSILVPEPAANSFYFILLMMGLVLRQRRASKRHVCNEIRGYLPSNLLDPFQPDEIADLLAFLGARKPRSR